MEVVRTILHLISVAAVSDVERKGGQTYKPKGKDCEGVSDVELGGGCGCNVRAEE